MTNALRTERERSALMTLSTVGAAIAGAGAGAVLSAALLPLAWLILAIGTIAHLFGMVGTRRLLAAGGYHPPGWQRTSYWLCWAAIAALAIYVVALALQ